MKSTLFNVGPEATADDLNVAADWMEENGDEATAYALRWMITRDRRPEPQKSSWFEERQLGDGEFFLGQEIVYFWTVKPAAQDEELSVISDGLLRKIPTTHEDWYYYRMYATPMDAVKALGVGLKWSS